MVIETPARGTARIRPHPDRGVATVDITCYDEVVAAVLDYLDRWEHRPRREELPALDPEYAQATLILFEALEAQRVTEEGTRRIREALQTRGAMVAREEAPSHALALPVAERAHVKELKDIVRRLGDAATANAVSPADVARLRRLMAYLQFAAYRAAQAARMREAKPSRSRLVLR